MQVCTLLQTDNHASTPPLCFLQAGCPSCRPTNSVKALKAKKTAVERWYNFPPRLYSVSALACKTGNAEFTPFHLMLLCMVDFGNNYETYSKIVVFDTYSFYCLQCHYFSPQ